MDKERLPTTSNDNNNNNYYYNSNNSDNNNNHDRKGQYHGLDDEIGDSFMLLDLLLL
jgi:hypothetical protein